MRGVKNSAIFSTQVTTDALMINTLSKLTGIKFSPEVKTIDDALYDCVWSYGILSIPLSITEENYIVIYDKLCPVASMCTHGVKGDYEKSKLFQFTDSYTTDPDVCFIISDYSFSSPDNLFILTNGTKFKKYISNKDHAFVVSAVFNNTTDGSSIVKQLISFRSFLKIKPKEYMIDICG